MPVYVCKKDGTDLTAAVERAINDDGPGVMNVDVVVEGTLQIADSSSGSESFLGTVDAEARDDLMPVVVTCPTDGEENVFMVRRRDD
jgi:hypothetical protein